MSMYGSKSSVSLGAEIALAVEHQFVRRRYKSFGKNGFDLNWTAGYFVDFSTSLAVKMMMVRFAGNFVAGWLAWQVYRGQPTFFHQHFDVAINGGNAEPFNGGAGEIEHFLRT